MQDFKSLCQARRSIRKYTDQPIEQDKIDYMLTCALMSPSGKRVNPWEFYVTTDTAKIRPLSVCRTYGSGMFQTAMGAIVVAVDASLTDVWQLDGAIAAQNLLLAAEDCGLGACWCQVLGRFSPMQDMSESAEQPKSNPRVTQESPKEDSEEPAENLVKRVFGIPENLTVVCVISLGYKNEERKPFDFEKLAYTKIHRV